MNFSTKWNDDMKLDNGSQLSTLQTMFRVQHFMFGILLVLGLYYCFKIATNPLMHFNFRLIMSTTGIYAILFSGSRLSMYILLSSTEELTDRTSSNIACMAIGTLHSMSIIGLICSMLLVGIERQIATIYVKGYESKKRGIGFLMLFVGLLIGTVSSLLVNFTKLYTHFNLPTTYQTCIVIELYPEHSFGSFVLGILGCLLSALWQFQLFRRNRSASEKKVGIDSLSVRFQQVENIHTTRIIFPVMLVYMLMCIFGLVLSSTRYCMILNGDYNSAKIVMQAGYMLIDCFCIFAMSFVLLFHPGLRYNVIKDICSLFCINIEELNLKGKGRIVDIVDEGAVYFKQLEHCWK